MSGMEGCRIRQSMVECIQKKGGGYAVYCERCGSELPQGAKFCEKCGSPVEQLDVKKNAEGSPHHKKWILGSIIGGVVLVSVVVVGVLFATDILGNGRAAKQADADGMLFGKGGPVTTQQPIVTPMALNMCSLLLLHQNFRSVIWFIQQKKYVMGH